LLAADNRNEFTRRQARNDAERRSTWVDPAQNTILVGRTCVADAGACRCDSTGGNATSLERRKAGHAGLVDPDPGVVEQRGERIVF